MGARPLKRLIQQKIKVPLSRELLFGEKTNGFTVKFDLVGEEISIVK
jgi:ATP-dependent Clp protease ATP-binding subunit ClpA